MTSSVPAYGASAASQRFSPSVSFASKAARLALYSAAPAGSSSRELRGDGAGDDPPVLGVEPEVRVAERVDVAHRARHRARRPLEDVAAVGGVEVAGGARADLVVAALVDQRRQVADLELEAGDDQQIRLRELQHERGLRVDEVRVLVALREGEGLDAVAADGVGDRREVLDARDDRGPSRRRAPPTSSRHEQRVESVSCLHFVRPQKGWAPWAPIANWIWRKPSLALMPGA